MNREKYQVLISEVCKRRPETGKKVIQKLFYLIERKGVDLELNYSIHFYGPYSATLDNELYILSSEGSIQIDTSGPTHVITSDSGQSADDLFKEPEMEAILTVLDKYALRTAKELEAITTVDYVADTLLKRQGTERQVIDEVMRIKGTKFTQEELKKGYDELKDNGLL